MAPPNKRRSCSGTLATLLLGLGSLLPAPAQIPMATEQFDRIGKTDSYGIGQYLHSDDISFNAPAGDTKVKMDDTGLGGLGFAYHFNDFISIHADLMFGGATFSANLPTETGGNFNFKQDAFIQTGRINVDYNIINRRITPFLTAGIGYQYIETELENAPPVGGAGGTRGGAGCATPIILMRGKPTSPGTRAAASDEISQITSS